MGTKRIEDVPADVKRVRVELDVWRAQRGRGHCIPEELWAAAVRAAGRHGLNRVSRVLGLDYYQLKKRSGLNREKTGGAVDGEQVFVELSTVASSAMHGACVVELEKGNGAKLRVSVRDAATVDWCRLKEAFLGA